MNNASGLCLDISGAKMANGVNVGQWTCNGEKWQKWYLEKSTGLIHSLQDPRYCLDNGGKFVNGANITIWTCNGGNNQRFVDKGNGKFGMWKDSNQVLDAYGSAAGDNVITYWDWGGNNQLWTLR
ncbi:MAG: RICIN domain-containing protein [Pseudomonadota bacterium]